MAHIRANAISKNTISRQILIPLFITNNSKVAAFYSCKVLILSTRTIDATK